MPALRVNHGTSSQRVESSISAFGLPPLRRALRQRNRYGSFIREAVFPNGVIR